MKAIDIIKKEMQKEQIRREYIERQIEEYEKEIDEEWHTACMSGENGLSIFDWWDSKGGYD